MTVSVNRTDMITGYYVELSFDNFFRYVSHIVGTITGGRSEIGITGYYQEKSPQYLDLNSLSFPSENIYCNITGYVQNKPSVDLSSYLRNKNFFDCSCYIYTQATAQTFYSFEEKEIPLSSVSIQTYTFANKVIVNYKYDYVENKYQKSYELSDNISIMINGEKEKILDLQMVQNDRTAQQICLNYLNNNKTPMYLLNFKHDIRSFYIEVGDSVLINLKSGINKDGTGWINKEAIVMSKKLYGNEINFEVLIKKTS